MESSGLSETNEVQVRLNLESPSGGIHEGITDGETWQPLAGLGLVFRLDALLDAGWSKVN